MSARRTALGGILIFGAIALSILIGCATKTSPAQTSGAPAVAPPPTAAARDSEAIRWVRDSAEYQASVLQTYAAATRKVTEAAATRTRGAWAVILDADETVLSNVQYQVERGRAGLGFSQESWTAWVRRREATAIPGAAPFLTTVRNLGGRIAIVTGRYDYECDDTVTMLKQLNLVNDVVLCRPSGQPSDKTPRFDAVAQGTTPMGTQKLEIVAFIGDNILDFPGQRQSPRQSGDAAFNNFGTRFFVLPNPMYGSWQ